MSNRKSFIITFQPSLRFLAIVGVLLTTFPALSQTQPKSIASPVKGESHPVYDMPLAEETGDMLYITMKKSKVLHLNRSVRSIKIDDPESLIVFIKNSRTLYVLAKKKKGITHFTALDKNGKTIIARYVLIEKPTTKYVHARILCTEETKDAACDKTRFYYCTGSRCYETYIMHNNETTPPH